MNSKNKMYFAGYISVTLIWGSSFLFVNNLVRNNIPVFTLMFFRFALGSILLLLYRKAKKVSSLSKSEWCNGILLGVVIFVAFALQTYGAYYTTPSKNGMLTGLYVFFVPLILLVQNKQFRIKPFIDAAICIAGMLILFNIFNASMSINLGDALTVLCAVAFSAQFIILEKYSPRLNAFNYTYVQLLTVTILSLIASVLLENGQYISIKIDITIALKIVYLGFLSTGYAYIMQTLVQAKISAIVVSILSCLESIFAVVLSCIFGYDSISLSFIVGSCIMVIAMLSSVAFPISDYSGKYNNKSSCS